MFNSGIQSWHGGPYVGLSAYMEHNPRGQLFARMVIEAGEAKARINKLYWRYCKWVRDQEKAHVHNRQDQLEGD